ncbi:class I adenylate-forming enzyme family protein [Polyangium mundeleinium]|uniref:AMP-binding protein n=1 Tax=Polyangium mundeleinium TaxID=2995306 RepID=A0ABT5ETN8_9BACT|nr:AMP-binding protein [Polyangium mundeleinium]MDC0744282.1 AMP-binding protein [Polyangium mundeleinium]
MDHDGLSLEAIREPGITTQPALIEDGRVTSFGELAAHVECVASSLVAQGLGPGCRAALRTTCDAGTVVTILALIELGVALVPIHPRLTDAEVRVITEDAHPDLQISPFILGDNLLKSGSFPRTRPDPSTPLAILYTSGTTGRPKGAVLSRGAFAASAEASAKNLGWTPDDRWLACMPLAHVGGLSIVTRCIAARRPIVLEPRFDPDAVLRVIRRERVTLLSVVPTMLRALFDADRDGILATLRLVLVGGAGAPPALLEEAAARRVLALTTYGLTEACSQVTCQPLRAAGTTEPGSGKALPGVDVRTIRDTGTPADPGEVGRIQVRGPTLMSGYLAGPGEPLRPSLTADGFFDTGDLGALDEHGRLFVHARRTDLVVTGGENVYPAEVEQALEALPGVTRAVVFGVPDERWGQIVAAGLALDPPDPARAAALVAEVGARLAPHKRPRLVAAVASLPLTASGKLDRARAVRELSPRLSPVPRRL